MAWTDDYYLGSVDYPTCDEPELDLTDPAYERTEDV